MGPEDGDILISLNENHAPTADYVKTLRTVLPQSFPGSTFSFLPADMVSQMLNFGAPAPIDVQVAGPDQPGHEAYATELRQAHRADSGRGGCTAAAILALSRPSPWTWTAPAPAKSASPSATSPTRLVVNLAGSFQVAPTFWLNPKNGVSYPIVIQTPQYRTGHAERAEEHPHHRPPSPAPQILGGISDIHREDSDAVVSHYAIQPAFDVYATTQDRDLGGVASRIQQCAGSIPQRDLPPGATVTIRGQVQTMNQAFSGLFFGLGRGDRADLPADRGQFPFLVRSFRDHHGAAGALAGIVWTLFATHTTLSVPALTGAIMCMGVATANSILVVSFARERLEATGDAVKGGDRSRRHPLPSGADDRARHDHRHGAHGAGPGRGRRAERAAGPRRDRRLAVRHLRHPVLRASRVRVGARPHVAPSALTGEIYVPAE